MTFATRQTDMITRQRDRFGESATFNRYTYGTDNFKAGTKGAATIAATAGVLIVRSRTSEGLDPSGGGGRVGVERFEAWFLASDLAWTPTEDDTKMVFGGVTYRPAAIESENDGQVWRVRFEKLKSES